jgi:AraC family transcriptional regulator, positive regulator of tynA and feaB
MQLEQICSIRRSASDEALAYWQDVIGRSPLDFEIDSADEAEFRGDMSKHAFGPLTAYFISVSGHRVRHTRRRGGSSTEGPLHLVHVRKGIQHVEHYDRQLTLKPGNCLLLDCQASFAWQFPEGIDALVLEIPRDWIRGWLPVPEAAVAKAIDARSGWGATLRSALDNLTPSSAASFALPQAAIAEQIAVLLALSIAPDCPSLTTHVRSMLRRVLETLRARCHEPALDPATVAATLGLSRRYIHRLLASAGTTFTRELYRVRLERAHRLLADKRFEDVRIAEIAWNCGFSEPSHFSRRFRERFGVPPTSFRCNAV